MRLTVPGAPPPPPAPPVDGTPARPRRGRLGTAVLVLVAAAAGAGLSELRQAQAERAEQRRAASVVDLDASLELDAVVVEPGAVRFDLGLDNLGASEVTVLQAEVRGTGVASRYREVVLAPGVDRALLVHGEVSCGADGARPLLSPPLQVDLRVRTATGERTVTEQVEPEVDLSVELDRTCGVVPPAEALTATADVVTASRRGLDLAVALATASRDDQRVLAVEGPPGSRAVLRLDGRDVALPLVVPGTRPGGAAASPPYLLTLDLPVGCAQPDTVGLDLRVRFDAGEGTRAQVTQVGVDVSRLPRTPACGP